MVIFRGLDVLSMPDLFFLSVKSGWGTRDTGRRREKLFLGRESVNLPLTCDISSAFRDQVGDRGGGRRVVCRDETTAEPRTL